MMFIIKSVILGIIQGLTEFLPVSSSGHLVLANHFLGFDLQDITFEIMLHLGTLLSVVIFFRKDIYSLLSSLVAINEKTERRINDRRVIWFLLIGTLVTGILGFMMKSAVEKIFYQPLFAASMLIVTGIIVYASDLIAPKHLEIHQTGVKRSIIIGISQAFAILPGISRSGTTIATSLFVGLKRVDAARFSFLLSIPAILGAALFELPKFRAIERQFLPGYLLGSIAAFISGYLVISLLMNLIKNRKLKIFSYYVWTVAAVTLFLLLQS